MAPLLLLLLLRQQLLWNRIIYHFGESAACMYARPNWKTRPSRNFNMSLIFNYNPKCALAEDEINTASRWSTSCLLLLFLTHSFFLRAARRMQPGCSQWTRARAMNGTRRGRERERESLLLSARGAQWIPFFIVLATCGHAAWELSYLLLIIKSAVLGRIKVMDGRLEMSREVEPQHQWSISHVIKLTRLCSKPYLRRIYLWCITAVDNKAFQNMHGIYVNVDD
jgi:hypothetical protein